MDLEGFLTSLAADCDLDEGGVRSSYTCLAVNGSEGNEGTSSPKIWSLYVVSTSPLWSLSI